MFNAGKGAVFTHDERNELDASIMDGSNLMAGAVAGVTTIKNPIAAAYAVMTKSNHVMLVGRVPSNLQKNWDWRSFHHPIFLIRSVINNYYD